MSKPELKRPVTAAILAFLVPGLGHLYQRRRFKAALFAVCILGTFATGMSLGDAKVVYFSWEPEKFSWPYLCQVWSGLPALPALAQVYLRPRYTHEPNQLRGHLSSPCVGNFERDGDEPLPFVGRIELDPPPDDNVFHEWRGELTGTVTTPEGQRPVAGELFMRGLDPLVAPDRQRGIRGEFQERGDTDGPNRLRREFRGGIPRSLWNSYCAPLQDIKPFEAHHDQSDLERAHNVLGTRFELGVLYTMVAGLLNVLAIYDALEGPAYSDQEGEEDAEPPPNGDNHEPPDRKS